ncbi:hypothetical protein [Microcoleus sp. FACHB-68]|nr:hypothetical protein [Microcoleus sp. FACHB-68]
MTTKLPARVVTGCYAPIVGRLLCCDCNIYALLRLAIEVLS